MLDRGGLPVGDDDVGLPSEEGRHEVRDALLGVLVVSVGVDDHVGAVGEGVVDAVAEGAGEPLGAAVADDVPYAHAAGDLGGAVRGAVVDHEDLDPVRPRDAPRDRLEDERQSLFLVQTGDLDEHEHGNLE